MLASSPGRNHIPAMAVVALAVAGCGAPEAAQHYRVPKPEVVYAANHVRPAAETAGQPVAAAQADRLLGAIVPHNDQTWYFKMVGPREAVATQIAPFRALIASLHFDAAQSPPRWQLPDSWQELPGTGQRLATLRTNAPGEPLEVSVIALATGPAETAVLDNVNRWRGQMGLAALTAAQLAAETETVELAQGAATLVDVVGSMREGSSNAMIASPHPEPPAASPAAVNNSP